MSTKDRHIDIARIEETKGTKKVKRIKKTNQPRLRGGRDSHDLGGKDMVWMPDSSGFVLNTMLGGLKLYLERNSLFIEGPMPDVCRTSPDKVLRGATRQVQFIMVDGKPKMFAFGVQHGPKYENGHPLELYMTAQDRMVMGDPQGTLVKSKLPLCLGVSIVNNKIALCSSLSVDIYDFDPRSNTLEGPVLHSFPFAPVPCLKTWGVLIGYTGYFNHQSRQLLSSSGKYIILILNPSADPSLLGSDARFLKRLEIVRIDDRTIMTSLEGIVREFQWAPTNDTLMIEMDMPDPMVAIWSEPQGLVTMTAPPQDSLLRDICWSPDGTKVLIRQNVIFNVHQSTLTEPVVLQDMVRPVHWSPNSRVVATLFCGEYPKYKNVFIKLFDATNGVCKAMIETKQTINSYTNMGFSPNGRWLAVFNETRGDAIEIHDLFG